MEFCGLLIVIIVLLINILIVNYVRKLERITCDCSENWKRDFVKYYSLITVILTALMVLVPLFFQLSNVKYNISKFLGNKFVIFVSYLYTLFGIVNVYSLFTYSQQIVLSRCDCSHSWERTFMYYYSMLMMSLYIFLASFVLITILCCGQLTFDLKSIKNIKRKIRNM